MGWVLCLVELCLTFVWTIAGVSQRHSQTYFEGFVEGCEELLKPARDLIEDVIIPKFDLKSCKLLSGESYEGLLPFLRRDYNRSVSSGIT